MNTSSPSLEAVLEAFALEVDLSRQTLERYVQEFPEFADAIIELSGEIFSFEQEDVGALGDSDHMRIQSAISQFQAVAARGSQVALAGLPVETQRALATTLGVPRQIITAFMERAVLVSSVPPSFIARLANELQSSVEAVSSFLAEPRQNLARAAKSSDKPGQSEQVAFEQLLHDAGVPEEEIARLLAA